MSLQGILTVQAAPWECLSTFSLARTNSRSFDSAQDDRGLVAGVPDPSRFWARRVFRERVRSRQWRRPSPPLSRKERETMGHPAVAAELEIDLNIPSSLFRFGFESKSQRLLPILGKMQPVQL